MVKFEGNIVQFGFGAVGKSFFEKVSKEIKFDDEKYFIITRDDSEYEAFVNMNGFLQNFIVQDLTKENYKEVFGKYLSEGDLLIDFADTVGTKDFFSWCAENNIMYINTGEADWPENWYSIFEENIKKNELKKRYKNKYPIVLQHGNNPGLVSHFVKSGIEYIVKNQFKKDKELQKQLKEKEFAKIAENIKIRMVQVNDIDKQDIISEPEKLSSSWCVDSFFFEMLSEATLNIGTHEKALFEDKCNLLDRENGFVELKKIAVDTKCKAYYPGGRFEGYLVPHEETITIAKSLETENYRPSTMFVYLPCKAAEEYLKNSRVNSYPDVDLNKPQDIEEPGNCIVRGFEYPEKSEVFYKEKIKSGTEYVGVLIVGEKFNPVWVGNRIEMNYLYKKKDSYWQTPTITPVAMSALAAIKWMIENKEKGGIYFPDEILDYKQIIKTAEKYISKTIYKTFKKEEVDFGNLQIENYFV